MYYILASHGEYAKACKESCEMITGKAPQFFVVTFTEDMTKDSVESAYREILGKHGEGVEKEKRKEVKANNEEPLEKNGIVNLRLDERLIHGQVAAYWTRTLRVTRIMVVDDEVVKDEVGKSALRAAVPAGINLSVLTAQNAAKRLNEGVYSQERVFLIVSRPDTITKLLENGVKVKEVNIGNLGQKEGRKQIKKSVFCTEKELQTILSIEKSGVAVYAQMVPNDEKKKFTSYLGLSFRSFIHIDLN
ncbi:PTS mannose/fructose/sorbose transporter subunit IIAB [Muricomes intestini]|uniref:PTS mannose/fructose/sorbose transporter subunit IIAB n=1 Tax=Muricomes intestini TaxID=1796634 RepID=UPI002FDD70D3